MPAVLAPGAFEAMGTVVSVRTGAADAPASVAASVVAAVFDRWESRCSLFDPASELSRVGRGELALADASEEVRDAYALALRWRDATDGVFTPHRGDGLIDLNGVVKALAVEEAGAALDRAGFQDWAIGAGGDVLVSSAASAAPRPVGIVDPADRTKLLGRIDLGAGGRLALATSGSTERGEHIWGSPGAPPSPFVQVTVAATGLIAADVLATTIVAGGHAALDECTARWDVDVLAVLRDGGLLATPGWPRAASGSRIGPQ
ncbi:MAG TPA: FAD:protein FMN transferase [Agromyces sp.]